MDGQVVLTERPTERFFRKLDWSAFWTACVVSFIVYCYTLAPTVGLEDSGELAVASDALGVPHPPGYPIWTLLSWFFTRIFWFVTFRGQPNPAWSVGLMSAVFGALATGMTAMLICRSGSQVLRESRHSLHDTREGTDNLICWVGGVVGSLLFAFSPVMWSQTVIVEVYSLNAFFLILVFLLTYHWMNQPSDKLLYLTGFMFGLGLTNYQVLLLAALPLAFAVFLRDIKLFRDFLIVGLPFMIVLGLMKRYAGLPGVPPKVDSLSSMVGLFASKGVLPPIVAPAHVTCYVYLIANFVVLGLAFFLLPRGRTVAITVLMVELGIAFYIYMPIVSDLRNPPMNWGYPRTWEGFKHALSRGQYERIKPADVFSPRFLDQIGAYLIDLRDQFTLPVALLGFLPFAAWQFKVAGRTFKAIHAAIVLGVLATAVIFVQKLLVLAGMPGAAQMRLDKVLIGVVVLLAAVGGVAVFVSQGEELFEKLRGRIQTTLSERVTVGLAMLGLAGAYLAYIIVLANRVARVSAPLREAGASVANEQVGRIIGQSAGIVILMMLPAVIVSLLLWARRSRLAFRMTIDLNTQKWIIATLLGFLTMSIMLIALANPKGDVQDTFIQRVKFISSHALYTFWIGYGLIFGLAVVDTVFRENRLVKWATLGVAAVLPLVPIVYLNGFNSEIIRKFGGAEQNGHDYGWQFGNYQLRGAEAITEELAPDEEPLPNPTFPREMGPSAVFFGGTDPGRFVPTYMIYGARVREDVYLITQNALADNTYMSVMRDLYGDQIWIPAQPDSARAFQRYVEEVQSGKRQKNAQLNIENGRVQVSGALGVMEINGILAQGIFDHNNYRHDFYVEESYVIPWMYPHLEPHGLIMKINPERITISDRMIRDDMDFWDWYTRRLIGDRKFVRDVVARKSFSKLRSAIAGLYSNRRRLPEAEYAFHQARMLYPLSPEANFRLAQEVLLQQRRMDEIRDLMDSFKAQDPHNLKVPNFLGHLDAIEKTSARVKELEELLRAGELDMLKALELVELYHKNAMMQNALHLMQSIRKNTNIPPAYKFQIAQTYMKIGRQQEMLEVLDECLPQLPANTPEDVLLSIARMYAGAGKPGKTQQALEAYLKRRPDDWKAIVDLAVLQLTQKNTEGAAQSLQRAIKKGGNQARALIEKDRRFDSIRRQLDRRAQRVLDIPGVLPGMPGQ